MANNEINDLTAKTTPVSTDEVEIQETGGGLSKKTTLDNLSKAINLDNVSSGTTNKVYTATEQTKLSGIETNADVTDATNVDAAGATMNSDTTLAGNGYFLDEDAMTSNSATKVASQQSIKAYVDNAISTAVSAAKQALFPVGAIYVSGVATNPNTLLGFGTWTQIEGKFLVGVSTTDTDFDLDDTGGAKTVTLTSAQSGLPAHNHGVTDPGHTHLYRWGNSAASAGSGNMYAAGYTNSRSTDSNTTGISINNNTATDASSSHENLPPFIAKYIWQRTA